MTLHLGYSRLLANVGRSAQSMTSSFAMRPLTIPRLRLHLPWLPLSCLTLLPRTVSDSSGKTWDISEIYGCTDLRQTRRHLPVVTAIVEGPRVRFPHPVACMFDTGSCLTLMTTDCAEELGADPLE